ncbi:carboxymuconolactone decarboxylase family protein [Saccharopolyspora elongata]|uniref:Carboxymuconolactone decarboxylase family protein n=1 Tax=Saccharopolyspora elongata TaxID=2530387 RepID=A0A4R4YUC6_9PSEU|nr:carboxymuconolactone decarboxylase family protein [Saccharopolyspora elongata]TDD47899.1 carboxymuconolactone decarboxylase family protein [Saccharopolyspora elongata]
MFTDHTVESAPAESRRAMEATAKRLGHLPAAIGRLAESPHLLDGFLKLSAMFEATTLDPLARETVILTIATRNECHLCVAMHTAKLTTMGASPGTIAALRDGEPLDDPRLEAIREFAVQVVERAGAVEPEALQAFLAHGYTTRNALEVVLGIGAYTMSTLANRLVEAPLDEWLEPFAWPGLSGSAGR